MKLSICMIVRNEEKYLNACLNSVKLLLEQISSELIIVDTGSTDKTAEIAKQYTSRLYFHAWNDDFSEMRNISIGYATGEWVLVLDGDEIFESVDSIVQFLYSDDCNKYQSASIIIRNLINEKQKEVYHEINMVRLFKNSNSFSYVGAIHEQPLFKHPVKAINSIIYHYGYLSNDSELMQYKFERNLRLLEQELKQNPKDVYLWYQLAQSYGMHKNFEQSLNAILKAYDLAKKEKNQKDYLYVYNQLARSYFQNKRYRELEEICLKAIKFEPNFIDFFYYLGISQMHMSRSNDAVKSFERYLSIHNKKSNTINLSLPITTAVLKEHVILNLCNLYYLEGNFEITIVYAKSIKDDALYKKALKYLVGSLIQIKNDERFIIEYQEASNRSDLLLEFWNSMEAYFVEHKIQYSHLFELISQFEDAYAYLCRFRHFYYNDKRVNYSTIKEKALNFNFVNFPVFFSEIVYYLLSTNEINVEDFYSEYSIADLENAINYLFEKFGDACKLSFEDYLSRQVNKTKIHELRVQNCIYRVLITSQISEQHFERIWKGYVSTGISYIRKIYSHELFEKVLVNDLKNDEHKALMYLDLAIQVKETDSITYIKYLRNAINIYPLINKGIHNELEAFSQISRINLNHEQNLRELENHSNQLKKNIQTLIEKGNLPEAKRLISSLEEIIGNDSKIMSFKGIIAIMENDFSLAIQYLESGVTIDENNFDLNFNLAYVYQLENKWSLAKKYYENASKCAYTEEELNEVNIALQSIEKNLANK